MKENIEDANTILHKFKKRENYVTYPTDDEQTGDGGISENEGKHTRTLRKNALKELNPTISLTETSDIDAPVKTRLTRRTRKFTENARGGTEDEAPHNFEAIEKNKKSKRKKVSSEDIEPQKPAKKKNKKKKGKRSNSFVAENITEEIVDNTDAVNKSNISNDSFHSAAGSPTHPNIAVETSTIENVIPVKSNEVIQKKKSNKRSKKNAGSKRKSSEQNFISEEKDISVNKNGTFEIDQPRRTSIKHGVDVTDTVTNRMSVGNISLSKDVSQNKNDTFDMEHRKSGNKRNSNKNDESDSENKSRKSHANTSHTKDVDISHNKNDTFDIEKRKSNDKRSSIKNTTIEINAINISKDDGNLNATQNKNNTFDIESSDKNESPKVINTTYEKMADTSGSASKSKKRKLTMDIDIDTDISSPIQRTDKTSLNSTYNKADTSVKVNTTFELNDSPNNSIKKQVNTTFEKDAESPTPKLRKSTKSINSSRRSSIINNRLTGSLNDTYVATKDNTVTLNGTFNKSDKINTTFDKDQNLNTTFDKVSKSSLISSDSNDDGSRISITSDESITEPMPAQKPLTIMNITPVLIDSSMDSLISEDSKTEVAPSPLKREGTFSLSDETKSDTIPTPLKREGTFTKDGPDDPAVNNEPSPAVTPKKEVSLPSPRCTPFPTKSFSKEKPLLNVTRSIEKRRSTEPGPRITRVMFCSPVNNPVVVAQQKRTVIKSNLKGSNKSFVYEESVDTPPALPRRKRSYTHSEADEAQHKRKRLADDLRHSVDRLSRPRTSSASAKLTETTPSKKSTTPSKAKVPRTKLPNFAALHQKQFDKMESLDECQERKAKRARQLLTPIPGVNQPDRSPKVNTDSPVQPKEVIKKAENLSKSFSQEASKQKYTRFGFKLNTDVNPFSILSKNPIKPKENLNGLRRQPTLPSLAGATSVRREVAKQTVMREKSFSDKRLLKRNENRTIIKGVRTNRRFELQMKLRNIE
ncbi:hypothetical protein O3G_MSEX002098 [Manduca sexta]|uniref:Uncharacterized protein n=2 Tax=Manduca sexta TaxID=7130 RepID=A0A921YMJ6_MANSE|nr:hypothetical protein O3G_MSEX002098 [Manduca sexta]